MVSITRVLRGIIAIGLMSVLALTPAGCSGGKTKVTGKVRYQGKTLKNGGVNFISEADGGKIFSSDISEDGSYTIIGCPPGKVKITVVEAAAFGAGAAGGRRGPGGGGPMGPPAGRGGGPPADVKLPEGVKPDAFDPSSRAKDSVGVPKTYGEPDSTTLTYTVTAGAQVYDIEIP
jgi:hypothetical protein